MPAIAKTHAVWILLCLSCSCQAEISIHRILTPRMVELVANEPIRLGQRYAVTSRMEGEVIGHLTVTSVKEKLKKKGKRFYANGTIISHSQNALLMVGDGVHPVHVDEGKTFPGRVDLRLAGERDVSARYKPLVNQGISIGQTAATLSQGEQMIDILGTYSYGVTESFMVTSSVLMDALAIGNLTAKYKVLDEEWITFSPSISVMRFFEQDLTSFSATFYFDFPTNSKLISYTAINVSTSLGTINGQSLSGSFGSSVRTGYAYIFDNWDRLLFGPKFNFDTRTVGGYVAYMFIWDHFHLSLNLETPDLMEFSINNQGYKPHLFLFWRI